MLFFLQTVRCVMPLHRDRWVASLLGLCVFGCLAGCLSLGAGAAHAADAPLASEDPALEARLIEITAELRCLVCQNQTIADSHAPLAVDLRRQVREMLKRGEGRDQIIVYMTARYGDFVLYRPPVRPDTWLLWFGPGALLLAGLAVLVFTLRARARLPDDQFEPDDEDNPPAASPNRP